MCQAEIRTELHALNRLSVLRNNVFGIPKPSLTNMALWAR
jgi:hypothetical protein